MALYDFKCEDCGNEFEVYVQGFLEDAERKCPKCGSRTVRQKFGSFLRNFGSSSSSGCSPSGGSGFG